MNRLCIFICMVCIGRINVAFIDKIVDPILSPVNQILDFVNNLEVEDVVGAINTIPELYSAIHDGPFIFEGSQSSEVNDFKNTLETCINKLTKIINPFQAFDELLTINVNLPFFTLPDSDDVIYTLLAVTLLPLKNVVNTACDEGVELITDIANKIIEGAESVTSRRRRMGAVIHDDQYDEPESTCDEQIDGDLCDPEEVSPWYYDGEYVPLGQGVSGYKREYKHNTYRRMVGYADSIIINPYDTSDTDNYVTAKNHHFAFTTIMNIVERVCQILDGCMQDTAECIAAGICGGLSILFNFGIELLGYALDAAEIHDGEINHMKIDRIFKDRVAIIHNQKELQNLIQESILGVSNENQMLIDTEDFTLAGIKTDITNLQTTVDEIKQTVTAPSDAHYAPEMMMAGNYIKKGEAEIISINIKINSQDLYVMIGVAIGFIVVFITMAVMLILKCCNGYILAQNNSRTISKYDYSPSI